MFYFVLLTALATLVCALLLCLTIKTFYWGPRGRPPNYRHGDWRDRRQPRRGDKGAGG